MKYPKHGAKTLCFIKTWVKIPNKKPKIYIIIQQGRKFIFAPKFKLKWIVELVHVAKICVSSTFFAIFAFSWEFNKNIYIHFHLMWIQRKSNLHFCFHVNSKGLWVCELCVVIFVQTKFFNGFQVALCLGFCVILEGEQGLRKNI
jgi:hypothetical protein